MRSSILLKVFLAGVLALVLLIPIAMVQSVVNERQSRRNDAIREVSEKWGGAQTVTGPILVVPFTMRGVDDKGVAWTVTEYAWFLPERLTFEGTVTPEIRRRGIFEAVLYGLELRVEGSFPKADLAALGVPPADVRWNEATLSFGLTDTRGIKDAPRLVWDGGAVEFRPTTGLAVGLVDTGIHAPLEGLTKDGSAKTFSFRVGLHGSQTLSFVPAGVDTRVALQSPWKDPSFTGAFLPDAREVRPDGFKASWQVSQFGRNVPSRWRGDAETRRAAAALPASSFGVFFFRPADWYQQATRAIKYAILFVGLTFGAFFLFEVFARLQLHPLQYLLVGFALALFYLLLVALSEHAGFGRAYLAAAGATAGLVSLYSAAVLKARSRAATIGGLLATLYAYLYILLRLEDYALLLGSVALFVLLALVMWLTRKIDWWGVSTSAPPPPIPPRMRPPAPEPPPVVAPATT